MSFRAMLGAVLVALSATSMAGAQALYSPPEGDFAVAFTAAPAVQVKPAHRSRDIAFRRYVDQQPSRAFVVAIDEYPQGALPQYADAGVYDHLLRDRAENAESKLVSTRAARLAGRPCLEGTFKDDNDTVEVVRVLMIGERIYQLTYAHADGDDRPDVGAAFFGSFRITAAP